MHKEEKQLNNPVFIVSTGRCGSTMLSRVLAIHPSLFVINQFPSLRAEAFVKWSHPGRAKSVERKIRKKREELLAAVRRNRLMYIENSTSAALLIDELYRLFDAKFIFIHRDGREFLRSGMSRHWYEPEPLLQRAKTWLRRRFLIDTGRDTVDTLLIPPPALKTRFEKIAWRWVEVNRIIIEKTAAFPEERTLTFSVASLDHDCLLKIHRFLGIPIDNALIREMLVIAATKPNRTEEYRFPSYHDWSSREKQEFKDIAGDMMRTLGYSMDDR